jgi:hypothetical protein
MDATILAERILLITLGRRDGPYGQVRRRLLDVIHRHPHQSCSITLFLAPTRLTRLMVVQR